MRIFVCIKSCNRPVQLANLLRDLSREVQGLRTPIKITVYDDGSDPRPPSRELFDLFDGPVLRFHWLPRHGKARAWELHNLMYDALQRDMRKGDLALFFDDDMRLCRRFFKRLLEAWKEVRSPKTATLHLMKDSSRQHATCWTGVRPEKVSPTIRKIQWVDGTFVASWQALAAIAWRLDPIPLSRWEGFPGRSTGVGEQLSVRLHEKGMSLYQVEGSLVVHADVPSQYNASERRRTTLSTVDFVDGPDECRRLARAERIEASLASIPSRVDCLEKVVEALLPQVDLLRCFLNGYDEVPRFLEHDRIVVASAGDLGDRGKFFWCEEPDGIQLICDDDIFYPPDYAAGMLRALERHGRKAVVGVHGVKLREPFNAYYQDRTVVHFALALQRDAQQDILGTGCLAYDPATIQVRRRDFREPNMADVWFGLIAQREGVPLVAVQRKAGWLKPQPDVPDAIYGRPDVADRTSAVLREEWRWRT